MRNNYADKDVQPFFLVGQGAADADVALSKTATSDQFWAIDWICWSYSGVPTNGYLLLEWGGATLFYVDITAAGPGMLTFDPPLYVETQDKNQTVIITLAAAGASVVGALNVRGR